ncbi:MAG: GNAT family N-acetyltransferase [Acidobacteria bacterium]|nr:GNAT family N-acetyltransferase [Acidobacteriota bacterium]
MSYNSANVSFLPGSSFDLDFLADLYTQTFADYFYPCVVTTEELARWARVEHLDLDRCPVLLVDDKPVGLATVGIRGERSYCKGFGVIVSHRGKGLAHKLCGEMVRLAEQAGARRMTLGVIKHNTRAVETYCKAGFQLRRELLSLEWHADADDVAQPPLDSSVGEVIEARPQDLLAHFDDLHAVQPIWNRDLPSLRQINSLQGLAAMSDSGPEAYVLFQAANGTTEIVDLAARTGARPAKLLGNLLRKLQENHPHLMCHNESADNPLLPVMLDSGFRETIRRLELERVF